MQIRINLHADRPRRGARLGLTLPGAGAARALGSLGDRYLLGAVVAVLASVGAVGMLFVTQGRAEAAVIEREATALRDSVRYGAAIAARAKAVARRDSLARELRVIAAIDSTRFVWAHVLDEVSQALPAYTWLTNVSQTSAPPVPPAAATPAKPAAGAKPAAPADTAVAAAVRFRVIGQTADIQALTRFMRELEASPFVRNVTLAHSEPVQGGEGREVTDFTLDAEYEQPARSALRTVSITVPVR